jgi:ketosteroid isomerase-like protein
LARTRQTGTDHVPPGCTARRSLAAEGWDPQEPPRRPHRLGRGLAREQWLARFGNGLENRAFAGEDAQVRDHGAASVVIGAVAQETSFQGRDHSGRFRLTLVAARPDDRWLVANVHIGPLQPAGPPSS